MTISFLKMNASGNDFIIVDVRHSPWHEDIHLLKADISKISNRKNVGCDQFVILKASEKADILMDIHNFDGSVSGACGNATRCVASLLMEEKDIDRVIIETSAGILRAWKEGDLIAVNMGKANFDWQQIPLKSKKNTDDFTIAGFKKFNFSAANVGNPHIVSFVTSDLTDKEFFDFGPKLETNNLFPEKTNVEFAQILSKNHIKVRVWERGAGETLACGSGACAVTAIALKKNLVDDKRIKVSFKGGDIFIEQQDNGEIVMIGDYNRIFSGVLDADFL